MDVSMLVDALMDDELYEEQMSGKYTDLKDFLYTEAIKSDWTAKLMNVTMKSNPNSSTIHWGFTGYVLSEMLQLSTKTSISFLLIVANG